MSKHPKRLDVTDFWNDCLKVKEPSSSNFSINNHINDSYNYNPKAKSNKRYINTTQIFYFTIIK